MQCIVVIEVRTSLSASEPLSTVIYYPPCLQIEKDWRLAHWGKAQKFAKPCPEVFIKVPEQKVVHVVCVDQLPEIVRKISQTQPDHARGMRAEACTAFDIRLPQIGHDIELAGIVQLVVRIACDYQIGGA